MPTKNDLEDRIKVLEKEIETFNELITEIARQYENRIDILEISRASEYEDLMILNEALRKISLSSTSTIEKLQIKIKNSDAKKETFNHDINNQLAYILGIAELAMDDANNKNPTYETLKSISTALNVVASEVKKTSTLNDFKVINTRKSINGIKYLISANLKRYIGLEIDIKSDVYVKLRDGDLENILINLCKNANHAMDVKGKIKISVMYTKQEFDMQEGNYVKISVKDSGKGIKRKNLKKIFDYRYSTKGEKRGIGLSSVKEVVQKNNGSIYVKSKVREGTEFSIYFPKLKEDKHNILVLNYNNNNDSLITKVIEKTGNYSHISNSYASFLKTYIKNIKKYDFLMIYNSGDHLDLNSLIKEIRIINPTSKIMISSQYGIDKIKMEHGSNMKYIENAYNYRNVKELILSFL